MINSKIGLALFLFLSVAFIIYMGDIGFDGIYYYQWITDTFTQIYSSKIELIDAFIKTPLVFLHFILAASAIITIISLDLKVLSNYTTPISQQLYDTIKKAENRISQTLYGLYITGIFFVVYGSILSPEYIHNPKVIFKIIVVCILTLNGMLVNQLSKNIRVGMTFASCSFLRSLSMIIVGGISSVSWLWACFLGIARTWNFKMPLEILFTLYSLSLVLTIIVVGCIVFYRKYSYIETDRDYTMET